MTRIELAHDKTVAIERFSSELKSLVSEVSLSLKEFFESSIDGVLGNDHRNIVVELFNEWCYRNDIVPLEKLKSTLIERFKHIIEIKNIDVRGHEIDRLVKDIAEGTRLQENSVRTIVSSCLADVLAGKHSVEEVSWSCAKKLLEDYISLFLDQTAHVVIARLLVYRVMEDKGYVRARLINVVSDQQFDPLKELIEIRRELETLLPNIYALSEFDWWYIPDIKRGLLSDEQRRILRRCEEKFRQALKKVVSVLVGYDLSKLDFDIWQKIYQHYLPETERQRLGGFYTPRELVSLIIDLAGYDSSKPNLCKMKVLDPASGSGTFIVEVTRRLIQHLESRSDCHTLPRTEWEKAKFVLETVKKNIYAIDIHPFATFLTSLNLMMLLLDYYLKVRHQDPEYRLELKVITADSLMKYVHIDLASFYANSRLMEARRRLEKYSEALSTSFNFVFGNPPWGSVLKGSLSPLWNPEKRKEYKKLYKSACSKYDIYVLFLERGVEWLKEGGILGMVVNNRFLTREFGKCIRNLIASKTIVKYLVDVSEYGTELFPEATNYPVVIILEKLESG